MEPAGELTRQVAGVIGSVMPGLSASANAFDAAVVGGMLARLHESVPREQLVRAMSVMPIERVLDDVLNSYKGAIALGSALKPVEEPVSPQMARSVQASINRWRQVMKDYRFLGSTEAGERLGSRSGNRSLASYRRSEGKLLGVKYGNAVLYPEFQFDETGDVLPVIPQLISLAKEYDWSEQSLILWLVTPTGYFDDEAPVKHLDDPERILAGARSRFEPAW